MVYIESWNEFAEQAEALVRADVEKARHTLKYITRGEAKLVLKVTDDRTVLQYRTDQQADVKKVVDLISRLFPLFALGEDAPEAAQSAPATYQPEAMAVDSAPQQAQQKKGARGAQQSRGKGKRMKG